MKTYQIYSKSTNKQVKFKVNSPETCASMIEKKYWRKIEQWNVFISYNDFITTDTAL